MNPADFLLDLLYPKNLVCPLCNEELPLLPEGVCESCKEQLVCHTEVYGPTGPLDGLAAGLVYCDGVKNAIHRFKYKGQVWLAPFFAGYMRIPAHWQADCLVPVPLFWFKRLKRTFNQSEDLARLVSRGNAGLPVRTDLLKRVKNTRQQALLSAEERAKNVAGAFLASPQAAGRGIILIDDVTTTHGTLFACGEALRQAGARRVYGLTACMARVVQPEGKA